MNDQNSNEETCATEQAVIAVNIAEYNATAAALAELRNKYKGVILEFAEFADEAKAAVSTVIQTLTAMHDRQAEQEAESARLEKERAELERQRAERAEQERIAMEAREAEEARLRAEREAFEEERRIFNEQRAAAQAAGACEFRQPAHANSGTEIPGAIMRSSLYDFAVGTVVTDSPDLTAEFGTVPSDAVIHGGLIADRAPQFVGVDIAAGDDQTVVANVEQDDADDIVRELAGYTSMQFQAMAKKVKAAGFDGLYDMLVDIAAQLSSGSADDAIKAGNWMEMADADKEMALASHACVSIVCGDGEMGASVLRGIAA